MLDSYFYQTQLEWTGRRSGQVTVHGFPPLRVSAPPEFSGDQGVWTPEHLLVGATAGCLMTTFLAIAELSRLTVISCRMRADAKLEKVPGEGYRFTEITLAPEIGVAAADVERAQRVLAKAEKNCFVSNSLRADVRLEPRFVATPAEAA